MKELFLKYHSKIKRESISKACLVAAVIGLALMFVLATVLYFAPISDDVLPLASVWMPLAAFALAFVIAAPLFYFKKFKPTTASVARRIDELGLDERIITMSEYSDDESYIARRQREDAMAALKNVNADMMKFAIPLKLVVSVVVVAVLAIAMLGANILAEGGVIIGGNEVIENIINGPTARYEISYDVIGDGYIDGDLVQIVEEGSDAEIIVAEPMEGYAFLCWTSDPNFTYMKDASGSYMVSSEPEGLNAMRQELKVSKDMVLYAVFVEADGSGDGDGDAPGEDGEAPGDPGEEGESGDSGENGEGGGEGGGSDDPANQIIDGDTYFQTEYDNARGDAYGQMGQNGNMSGGDKDIGGSYFDSINDGGNGGSGSGNGQTP